jgi:hypothetical protein
VLTIPTEVQKRQRERLKEKRLIFLSAVSLAPSFSPSLSLSIRCPPHPSHTEPHPSATTAQISRHWKAREKKKRRRREEKEEEVSMCY